MAEENTPIGEMVLVGTVAFQLYSRIYYGRVEYYAEIGRPWTNKKTGVTGIVTQMKSESTRDFLEAAKAAAAKLEEIRNAQFRHGVASAAQSISPLEQTTDAAQEEEKPEELKLKLA